MNLAELSALMTVLTTPAGAASGAAMARAPSWAIAVWAVGGLVAGIGEAGLLLHRATRWPRSDSGIVAHFTVQLILPYASAAGAFWLARRLVGL